MYSAQDFAVCTSETVELSLSRLLTDNKKHQVTKNICSQAVKHLRTPEFKPYVIFVKPLIPEKKKHILKSPMSEEISVPLVSIPTLISSF